MTQQSGSVSFDRAAGYYDRTRALPEEAAAAQTALLLDQLRTTPGRCLEIGVGTGRVALPLVRAGAHVVGLDLSPAMLAQLTAKAPGALPLACADATRLPFRDDVFGAAIAAHVLHLVSDWRVAVAELQRVVRPGGLLLATRGTANAGLFSEIQTRLRSSVGWQPDDRRLDTLDPVDDYLRGRGALVAALPAVVVPGTRSAEDYLRCIDEGVLSWTWPFSATRLSAAVREVRGWLREEHGEPANLELATAPLQWRSYRLPDG